MAVSLVLGLGAPAAALADGPVDPIATNFAARVLHTPPGVVAKVVDGYLQLWVSVAPGHRVTILDQLGAPWLRFGPDGVFENHNSLLYYISQVPVEAIPPKDITAATPPHWFKVSGGHSWMWRDGRLQAFAHQSLPPGTRYAGPWSIGVIADGVHTAISGGLYVRPAPTVVWFWPVAVILLCVIAAWRVRSDGLDRRVVRWLTHGLLGALAIVAVARLLHGRPNVSVVQIIEFVAALAGIGTGVAWSIRGRFPAAIPFIVGFIALWAGLTFLPVLTHWDAQLILPAWIDRAATVLLLGGSLGLVLLAMRRPLVE